MKTSKLFALSTLVIAFLFGAKTFASGTYSPGGTGGDSYNMGKLIFYKKVVCRSCPFPGRGKTAEDAKALIDELSSDELAGKLSENEREAAISFLLRRYK